MQASARSNISAMNCPICMEVMNGNIYLCKFGHSVCSTCKSGLKQTCPQCRIHLTENRNYQLEELIKEMKILLEFYDTMGLVKCSFSENGCAEQMDVKSIQKHEKQCQNRLIFCSFANGGCTEFSTRQNIQNHERTCQFRTVSCVHGCENGIPIAEVSNHNSFCENGKYPCRFFKNGCIEIMKFCELRDHEIECKHRSIHCSFSKSGCEVVGKLTEVEEHESNCSFRTTACGFLKNGCKAIVALSEKDNHESVCKFRIMSCIFAKEGCLAAGKTDDIQQHLSSCKFRKLPCSFNQKGCSVVLKLPEIEKHEFLCEFRSINCIFSTNGCLEKVKVSELEQHEKKCKFRTWRISVTNFCDIPLRCHECKFIIFNFRAFSGATTCKTYCGRCANKIKNVRVYRNYTFENLIKEIRKRFLLPCKYKNNGCDQSLDLSDKNVHETECEYRDVLCKISPCTWKGKIKLLSIHTLLNHNLHQMILKDGEYYSYNMLENIFNKDLLLVMLKAGKELFSCSVQKDDDEIYWAVQLIGQRSVAKKYTYKIKIATENQEIVGVEVCESDNQTFTKLIDQKRCVCFSYNTFEKFIVDDCKLKFTIVIKKQLQ